MSDIEEFDHGPTKKAREEVIEKLKEQYSLDNLDFEVFEKRLEIATNTSSRKELYSLISDLPTGGQTRSESRETQGTVVINRGPVKEEDTFFALLSGTERKGPWKPARQTKVFSVLGGVDLDYSQAEFPPGVSEIEVFALLGGVDIKVPEGVNVETAGVPAILGGVDNRAVNSWGSDAPTLRIRGFVVLGGIDIKVKKRKGNWGGLFKWTE